jgi:hypothetical protein
MRNYIIEIMSCDKLGALRNINSGKMIEEIFEF